MNINRPLIQTLSWLAVLLWMLAIYLLSAQPAGLSNANSKGIVTRVVDTTVKLTKAKITEPQKLELIERINSVAREYMHGVVFLVLGLLAQNAAAQSGARGMKAIAISLAICVAYAVTDEIHQLYVPGRAFQVSDIAMDAVGSMMGIGLVYCIRNRIRNRVRVN
ncbi:VanZ like family protein [Pelotomaculum schinkii]|uniref:VanZ like family protein n=1 Tax=Pelotomaculum schinkii TaxID=78350 RepID=A0A4Y7RIM6_9FIRM|nr:MULTISPECIES: VanZ family protein [Pelotomaculum]TEB08187.1 VanZ like family protein [Pelotomaculum schinkii]TEB14234.1 VanZ like family protein [Pelotomaculum sp. FP]